MSQCEAAESSSQVNPQVIDGKERSPLDEVLRQGASPDARQGRGSRSDRLHRNASARSRPGRAGGWWCATVTPASAPSSAAWVS